MYPYPTTFTTSNTHRVVHLLPEHRPTDFARIEDLTADATMNARTALSLQEGLYPEAHGAMAAALSGLADHVASRCLLNDEARNALKCIVETCERLLQRNGDDAVVEAVQTHAQAALDCSHRASDLLAAEAAICRIRRIPVTNGG